MTKLKHILTLDIETRFDGYHKNATRITGVGDRGVAVYHYVADPMVFDGHIHLLQNFKGKGVDLTHKEHWHGPDGEFADAVWAHGYDSYSWGSYIEMQGYRSNQAFKEALRPLSAEQKSKLTLHIQQFMQTPEIIGVVYRGHSHQVVLFGETWVTRNIGIACAVQEPTHDYEVKEIKLFQPLEDDSLESPLLDGIKLLLPSEPILHKGGITRGYKNFWAKLWKQETVIHHTDKLVITDLAEPKKAYVWEILNA